MLPRETPGVQSPLLSSASEVLPPSTHSLFPADHPHPTIVQSFAHTAAKQSGEHGFFRLSAAEVLLSALHSLSLVDQPQGALQSCAHLEARYVFFVKFFRSFVHTIAIVAVEMQFQK